METQAKVLEKFKSLADDETISHTVAALKQHNIDVDVVNTKAEALEKIKQLIPAGASVNNGASVTLEEIGYVDYLKSGTHPWNNLKEAVLAEKDEVKQNLLRRQTTVVDYFLGSVHAVTEDGKALIASNSSSQLPGYTYTAAKVIWVVGIQKIVKDLDAGMKRIYDYVLPLESVRFNKQYNMTVGSFVSKLLIVNRELMPNRTRMILVKEILGF
jgi:hypothetical protein